jgi:hypothetical protein
MSSSEDATVKIWDLREGQLLYTLRGHEAGSKGSTACAFSPGAGTFLASGSADKRVLVWKTNLEHGSASFGDGPEYLEAPPQADKPAQSRHASPRASPRASASGFGGSPLQPTSRHTNQPLSGQRATEGRLVAGGAHKEYLADDVPPFAPPHSAAAPTAPNTTARNVDLPEVLTATLDHIVGQLDMLTRTMQILEARVSHTEDRIAAFTHVSRLAKGPTLTSWLKPIIFRTPFERDRHFQNNNEALFKGEVQRSPITWRVLGGRVGVCFSGPRRGWAARALLRGRFRGHGPYRPPRRRRVRRRQRRRRAQRRLQRLLKQPTSRELMSKKIITKKEYSTQPPPKPHSSYSGNSHASVWISGPEPFFSIEL